MLFEHCILDGGLVRDWLNTTYKSAFKRDTKNEWNEQFMIWRQTLPCLPYQNGHVATGKTGTESISNAPNPPMRPARSSPLPLHPYHPATFSQKTSWVHLHFLGLGCRSLRGTGKWQLVPSVPSLQHPSVHWEMSQWLFCALARICVGRNTS